LKRIRQNYDLTEQLLFGTQIITEFVPHFSAEFTSLHESSVQDVLLQVFVHLELVQGEQFIFISSVPPKISAFCKEFKVSSENILTFCLFSFNLFILLRLYILFCKDIHYFLNLAKKNNKKINTTNTKKDNLQIINKI
jgi:hypothetical protein